MISPKAPRGPLRELARLYGAQTAFHDVDGRRKQASSQSLLAVLKALGAPIEQLEDAPSALRERRQKPWQQGIEPVTVAWDGNLADVELRLPAKSNAASATCQIVPEHGDARTWREDLSRLSATGSADVEGVRYATRRLPLPGGLPSGYHRLSITVGGTALESTIVSAPRRAYERPEGERTWGLFAPLYALHSRRSWGIGDFSDLRALAAWVGGLGGATVATLPILASFLDEPFEPSPYAPVSRLFWNELYIDATRAPELSECPAAQAIIASPEFERELEAERAQPLVDYRGVMALKRQVLALLAETSIDGRQAAFNAFRDAHPAVDDYARFRAAGERLRTPWPEWPQPLRDGHLQPADYDPAVVRYHLYVQWLANEQLQEIAGASDSRTAELHLDLPLGTHPAGYDVWRERGAFAPDVSVGAPPDTYVPTGQNWAFQPLNPAAERERGYPYFIASLRHHLQYAGSLRIDHVMGLHRLYWIPSGLDADQGVYVRYPAEELYAILNLESHRNRAVIFGEDLGTVPREVRTAMMRHGLRRSYVLQIEPSATSARPFGTVPAASMASLNTHDHAPFAAYWHELDMKEKQELGARSREAVLAESRARRGLKQALVTFLRHKGLLRAQESDEAAILRACLAFLAASRTETLLVNLEDLWLEVNAQNMPGTWQEHPNWQRRLRYALEEFRHLPEVVDVLRQVDRLRKGKRNNAPAK